MHAVSHAQTKTRSLFSKLDRGHLWYMKIYIYIYIALVYIMIKIQFICTLESHVVKDKDKNLYQQ